MNVFVPHKDRKIKERTGWGKGMRPIDGFESCVGDLDADNQSQLYICLKMPRSED
jgi:hypothetical protein